MPGIIVREHKRVLIGAATLEPGAGGISAVARMTIRALAESGRDVTAVSYLDRHTPPMDGVRLMTAGGSKWRYVWLSHRHALPARFSLYDSVGLARARLPGVRRPYAVWMHGIEAWEDMRAGAAAIFRNAALVLANSAYTLRRFERLHGPLSNACVCALATEADDPPRVAHDRAGPPTVLILGRIARGEQYKGHAELLDCWPAVVARIPDARLVIAGGGDDLPAVRERARTSSVAANIDLPGFVADSAIEALWARAHVFAMPSRGEGFGLVFVEAMRHGIPVVASVHDAGGEVNVHDVTGYNVDLQQPGDLAARLIALLLNPAQAQALGANGFALWRERYRYTAFRARFLAAIADMPM